jgi:hypothetical protein
MQKLTKAQLRQAASHFGKMAKGIPKHYSPAELEKRRARLAQLRLRRWPVKLG